jgi:hypothetical protein
MIVRYLGAVLLGVLLTLFVQIVAKGLDSAASTRDGAFVETFDGMRSLEEAASMTASASADWWVSSGGRLVVENGVASTLFGNRPEGDRWRLAYGGSSPVDTDGGTHPQNLFRLLTQRTWREATQEARFRIRQLHASASPRRDGSNGILFLVRYQNRDTLYYAGVRVDGAAVVKKKFEGEYSTLGYRRIFPGTYDREKAPILLPLNRWFGLRVSCVDTPQEAVRVTVEVREPSLGNGWVRVLDVLDQGEHGAPIRGAGHGGIRTDFMDVEIDDYAAEPLA